MAIAESPVSGGEGAAAPAPGEVKPGVAKKPKTLAGVYVQTPKELRDRLEQVAAADNKTPQVWVRDHLASMWGITLPEATKRTRYASEAERKAAAKAKAKDRQQLIAQLMKEYKARMEAAARGNGSEAAVVEQAVAAVAEGGSASTTA